VDRLGFRLGLGSGPHFVGRLGSGMRVSPSFQIIHRPVGRLALGLGSVPHVLGRLASGPRVGVGLSPGVFSVGGCLRGELSPGGYIQESQAANSSAPSCVIAKIADWCHLPSTQ